MTELKKCFVVMPIRRDGTPEHAHFKALYNVVLKPTLAAAGYAVTRGDEVQEGSAITKDIVLRLAEADLVVADLSDLNPNVFYELGVRHVFRRSGTIIISDEQRTKGVPFDLTAYRVLWYRGDFTGLDTLRHDLTAFVQQLESREVDHIDNPVHDWIPALPPNALASLESSEGKLRQQIAGLESKLREYEKKHGVLVSSGDATASGPLDVVTRLIRDAEEGSLPQELLEQALEAAGRRDRLQFLMRVRRLMERRIRIAARELLSLMAAADTLDMEEITAALFDYGRELYPTDKELRQAQLSHFAHSDLPSDRARARQELLHELGIVVSEAGAQIPDIFDQDGLVLLGIMLDAYHRDNLHDQALEITKAISVRFPDSTIATRNYARALENVGRAEDALALYQRALWCPDVSDTTANWLGNELHNRGRFVDAVEAYLCACILAPEDAEGFSHVADDLSRAMRESNKGPFTHVPRRLPEDITVHTVRQAIAAMYSCRFPNERERQRCVDAALREDISIEEILADLSNEASHLRMGENDRQIWAAHLYGIFRSEITDPNHISAATSLHHALKMAMPQQPDSSN